MAKLSAKQKARAKANARARGVKPGAYDYLKASGKKMKSKGKKKK